MRYDIKSYLDSLGIDYKEHGQNVMKEHVAINCPICNSDPSFHCNIKYDGSHLLCFICHYQSYNSINILEKISGEDVTYNFIRNIMEEFPIDSDEPIELEEIPSSITEIRFNVLWYNFKPLDGYHKDYLYQRYIDEPFYTKWNFKTGIDYGKLKYSNRIIIPVRDLSGRIVNFTGRSVFRKPFIRYKNCPANRCIVPAGGCLYGLYESKGIGRNDILVVLEGAFDAMRFLQKKVPAVALFKKKITQKQLELIVDTFENRNMQILVCLDRDAKEEDVKELADKFGLFFNCIKVLKLKSFKDISACQDDVVSKIISYSKRS